MIFSVCNEASVWAGQYRMSLRMTATNQTNCCHSCQAPLCPNSSLLPETRKKRKIIFCSVDVSQHFDVSSPSSNHEYSTYLMAAFSWNAATWNLDITFHHRRFLTRPIHQQQPQPNLLPPVVLGSRQCSCSHKVGRRVWASLNYLFMSLRPFVGALVTEFKHEKPEFSYCAFGSKPTMQMAPGLDFLLNPSKVICL